MARDAAVPGTAPLHEELPDRLQGWRRRTNLTIPEAAIVLGVGKDAAYAAASRGELPTISLGRKLRVPVAGLRRLLGELQ